MNIKLSKVITFAMSAIILAACQNSTQNPILHNQTTQTLDIPIVKAILDSDGDGYSDDIDMCPGTPTNIVTDERGCPINPIGIGLKMEYRAFFAKGSSEL